MEVLDHNRFRFGVVLLPQYLFTFVILVDDRGENIAAAHRAGFGVLQVSDERGISMADAKSLVVRLQECRRAFAGLEKAERKLTSRK